MKTMLAIFSLLLFGVLLMGSAAAAPKIVLKQYPDLKMGLLNNNFAKQYPLNKVESVKKVIDLASEQGFWWIEVCDPMADFTLAECKELAAYAKQKSIEVAYRVNVGLLDPDFWEVFSRGLANAGVFDGPRTIRTAAPGLEFAADEKKTHWTFGEIQKAVKTANQAANLAKAFGLQYVVENAYEVIKGDGMSKFGTAELFGMANSNLGFEFDTGNFFCTSRVWTKLADAQAFIEKYASRIAYIHLKTSGKDHKPQQVLGDNELDFAIIFALATKHSKKYIAFELDQPDTLEQAIENHRKSIAYLTGKFGG